MTKDDSLRYLILVADLILVCALCIGWFFLAAHITPVEKDTFPLWTILGTMMVSFFISQTLVPPIAGQRFSTSEKVVARCMKTTILFFLVTIVLSVLMTPKYHFPRFFFVTFFVVFFIALTIERITIRKVLMKLRNRKKNLLSTVLVGNLSALENLWEELSAPYRGYEIHGIFTNDPEEAKAKLADWKRGGPKVIGNIADIYQWVAAHGGINEMYVALDNSQADQVNLLSKFCDNHLIRFYYVPETRVFNGNFITTRIGETHLFARRDEPLTNPFNKLIKRGFDLLVSSCFLVLVYPWIYLWVAYRIKKQSPGPVYFKQERTGIDGKVFKCYKFRSMHVNDQADKIQATKDDPRKFPFGDFLRRTNIDELPQLINVWKGEMSIVGPRPHMLKHTKEYSQIINRFMVRHFVKPGLTGLAQVSGYRGEIRHLEDMEARVKKDIEYIENWSPWLDLKIIWKTATNMAHGEENAY